MLHFLRKTLHQNPTKLALLTHFLINPFHRFLSQKTQLPPAPPPSLIQYLTDSCFLTPETALSAAKKLKNKTPKDPDSILTFLKTYGFSDPQISKLISQRPQILVSRLHHSIVPKIQFLEQIGLGKSAITHFISTNANFISANLENRIKPLFQFIQTFTPTGETLSLSSKYSNCLFAYSLDKAILPNVTLLLSYQVPKHRICKLITCHPMLLTLNPDRFSEIVRRASQLGFEPLTHQFVEAVRVMGTLSRSNLEAKFETYRSFGWSDDVILTAFRRHPSCLTLSEEKIKKGMSFFRDELGWNLSILSSYPVFLSYSLEKRILPRYMVLEKLKCLGLVKKGINHVRAFKITEKMFLDEYVNSHQEHVSDLMEVFMKIKV